MNKIMKEVLKNKEIWDYFDEVVEYPKNICDDPIPYGVCWTYISSTFLNGFINYIKPFGCYVINRYTQENEDISDRNISVRNKKSEIKFEWEKFQGTKKELIDLIISGEKEMYHTNLSCFGDDLIIIGEIEDNISDNNMKYIFFWFDMDVSDCSIGRFKTEDSKEEILKSIENCLYKNYVLNKNHEANHDDYSSGFYKLPLSFLKGWLRF